MIWSAKYNFLVDNIELGKGFLVGIYMASEIYCVHVQLINTQADLDMI